MKKIGFLLNPVAGLGGRVGLKGTDGMVDEALKRGAIPLSQKRAQETLAHVPITFLTCSAPMGQQCCKNYEIIYVSPSRTTAHDTQNACRVFLEEEVDLVIFSGGDGTARDIYDVIGQEIPILGIPAGVKMHSSVFAVTPSAAQIIIQNFCQDKTTLVETEIMDIDEQAFRQNLLQTKLYGYALTPYMATLVQSGKSVYSGLSDQRAKKDIARFVAPLCKKGIVILGGGGTVGKIAEELGIKKGPVGY